MLLRDSVLPKSWVTSKSVSNYHISCILLLNALLPFLCCWSSWYFSQRQNWQCTQWTQVPKYAKNWSYKFHLESLPKYYLILGIRTLVKRLQILRIHLLLLWLRISSLFSYFTTEIVTLAISLLSVRAAGLIIFSKVVQLKNKLSLHGIHVLNWTYICYHLYIKYKWLSILGLHLLPSCFLFLPPVPTSPDGQE